MSTALPYEPAPIEYALQVAQHLGLKSEECWRLYHTASVVRDLRFFQKVSFSQHQLFFKTNIY